MSYRFLSYTLGDKVPSYGKFDSIRIKNIRSIARGDSANMYDFLMNNHCGTHIDTPNHFFPRGTKIADYPADFWCFRKPQVIRFKLAPSDIILLGEWTKNIRQDCDILFFYSGWAKLRNKNMYMTNNPGIHPEVGLYLRNKHPNLKAIGIDWVSISPYRDRKLGQRSHQAFLDPQGKNKPVLIIEDMNLTGNLSNLIEAYVLPLRVNKIDSAPCTAIGFFSG